MSSYLTLQSEARSRHRRLPSAASPRIVSGVGWPIKNETEFFRGFLLFHSAHQLTFYCDWLVRHCVMQTGLFSKFCTVLRCCFDFLLSFSVIYVKEY